MICKSIYALQLFGPLWGTGKVERKIITAIFNFPSSGGVTNQVCRDILKGWFSAVTCQVSPTLIQIVYLYKLSHTIPHICILITKCFSFPYLAKSLHPVSLNAESTEGTKPRSC